MSYSSNGNRPKLSEKELLTPDNCVVALIDDSAAAAEQSGNR